MKRKSILFLTVIALAVTAGLIAQGCGGGGGSKKSGGVGTGTSTGTGTGTGTGPNGNPGDAIGIDFTIAVLDSSASSAWVDAFKSRLNQTQSRMWTAYEGQMYMKNVTIKIGGSTGQVRISPLTGTKTSAPTGQTCVGFSTGSYMQVSGEFMIQAWLHEWCHLQFSKIPNAEEYDCEDPSTGVCIMNVVRNPPNERWLYCDQSNCLMPGVTGGICWENWFLKRYKDWKHPNTGYSGSAPAMNVTVE